MKRQLKIIAVLVLAFLVYMAFFDQNNWLLQKERARQLQDTKDRIEHLEQENEQMEAELKGLQNNPATVEKYARQKYFHKKDNEDVYIVVDTLAEKKE